MNKELHKRSRARTRQQALEDGFYDGRFLSKVVQNKKKMQYLKFRKNKFKIYD